MLGQRVGSEGNERDWDDGGTIASDWHRVSNGVVGVGVSNG